MAEWSELSKERAVHLLAEVGFDDRIIGYESSASMGNAPFSLYSLQEVHDFLCSTNRGGHIGYVDIGELTTWVGEVLGDRDLAKTIEETTKADDCYGKCAEHVVQLMRERLEQARAIVAA